MSNVYEGFQVAVSYESCMEKTTANPSNTDCNSGTATTYDDVVDVSVGYSGNFEGVDISLTYGNVTGNTEIDKAGSDAGTEYNNLENHTYSVKVAVAGFTGVYTVKLLC